MAVESALIFGAPEGEGGLGVELGTPVRAGRRTMKVPVTIAIPTDAVVAVPDGDVWVVKIDLRMAALDESSRQSKAPTVPLEFRFPHQPAAGKAIPYRTEIELRRTEQVLVITATDPVGGRQLVGAPRRRAVVTCTKPPLPSHLYQATVTQPPQPGHRHQATAP